MTEPITLKDLRVSERRIAKATALAAKRHAAWTQATEAVSAEKLRHDAPVELYRRQAQDA